MDTSQLGKNQTLNHFLSFIFFYIFYQSANINWMRICSVSHAMIIFSLIYYWSIHHGNKYPSSSWKLSINISQNWCFDDMYIKINNKLKFLSRKNSFVTPALRRLLCNALIQPHSDYACSAWYPNLTKKSKYRIETTQNKCMCFFWQLDKLKHISHEEFERLNWLPATYRFKQCANT